MAKKKNGDENGAEDAAGTDLESELTGVLKGIGVDIGALSDLGNLKDLVKSESGARVKMVCVASDLSSSLKDLGGKARGNVIMVRVDDDTQRQIDAWVETGTVKSRSEAAALFIREGLRVREGELSGLSEAIKDVEAARARLKEKARKILGEGD